MANLIQLKNLRDFSNCSNYAKYNLNNPEFVPPKSAARKVVESCYRDVFVLNKTVDWKTVRNRINTFATVEPGSDSDSIYSDSVAMMSGLRDWYLKVYRDGPIEGVGPFSITYSFQNEDVQIPIDGLLTDNREIVLLEYRESDNIEELIRDVGLRVKLLLLSKQNIQVKKVLILVCSGTTVRYRYLPIDNLKEWNAKTEQVLNLMVYSMKNKIYYPNPGEQCVSCKFRNICSW